MINHIEPTQTIENNHQTVSFLTKQYMVSMNLTVSFLFFQLSFIPISCLLDPESEVDKPANFLSEVCPKLVALSPTPVHKGQDLKKLLISVRYCTKIL